MPHLTTPPPVPPAAAPGLLDALAARDYLGGIGERTLRRYTAPRGPLVPTRIGRRVLYSRSALERFIAEREDAATPDAAR